jgi:hypothetical protein
VWPTSRQHTAQGVNRRKRLANEGLPSEHSDLSLKGFCATFPRLKIKSRGRSKGAGTERHSDPLLVVLPRLGVGHLLAGQAGICGCTGSRPSWYVQADFSTTQNRVGMEGYRHEGSLTSSNPRSRFRPLPGLMCDAPVVFKNSLLFFFGAGPKINGKLMVHDPPHQSRTLSKVARRETSGIIRSARSVCV